MSKGKRPVTPFLVRKGWVGRSPAPNASSVFRGKQVEKGEIQKDLWPQHCREREEEGGGEGGRKVREGRREGRKEGRKEGTKERSKQERKKEKKKEYLVKHGGSCLSSQHWGG
jgi:hypothetical protein